MVPNLEQQPDKMVCLSVHVQPDMHQWHIQNHLCITIYHLNPMDVVPCVEERKTAGALTISQGQGTLQQQLSKEKVEWLREQRESHKYKTIWTKDAHGGPYKKVWKFLRRQSLNESF